MKRFLPLLSLLVLLKLHHSAYAQQTGYWQQHVDYEINVVLDDVKHALDGSLAIRYTNNSPDVLSEIWIHLWPNAYKDNSTAFARQKLEQRSTRFRFATDEERGYIDNLNFKVNGESVTLTYDAENPDIARLTLNQPLQPGQTINIKSTFHVQLPYCFSRLGHVGQQYQITQWYPKPAVYDSKGWHPIPYLDQGEFYSEFGNFHVYITVPKNYVVGASGDLLTQSEVTWLDSLSAVTMTKDFSEPNMEFPPSSSATKTLEYVLKDAHDFAWFADKRFNVIRSSVTLAESERVITTYAYFPDKYGKEWIKAADYVGRAVAFYSDNVGEYPWNTAQAVDGTLEVEGAGGMEYPTITVIAGGMDAEGLDNVITHEVGHNWFYGILGSNEREHAWMDEGINSFYENRYMSTYYVRENVLGIPPQAVAFFGGDTSSVDQTIWQFNQVMQCQNKFQPVDVHATEYTQINYGLVVYMQTAYYFRYLEDVLGKEEFDRIMRKYYREYQFKHPYPDDLQNLFEQETGESFAWFFDQLLTDDRGPDYKVHNLQKGKTAMAVTVTNNSPIAAPFSIALLKGDSVLRTDWYRGFTGSQTIYLNITSGWDVTHVQLDHRKYVPETNRENNTIRTSGLFKTVEPLQLKMFGVGADDPTRTTIGFAPLVGWNNNDRWMLGLGFWNSTLPTPMLDYVVAPMYSIYSGELVGQGSVGFNLYPDNGLFDRIRLSESISRYTFDQFTISPLNEESVVYHPQFLKLQTQLELDLHQKQLRKQLTQRIILRSVYVQEDDQLLVFDQTGDLVETLADDHMAFEGRYVLTRRHTLFPHKLDAVVTAGEDFARASLTYQTKLHYPRMDKGVSVRLFAGAFLTDAPGDDRWYYSLAGPNGQYDPMYDHIYLGRNTGEGFVGRQMAMQYGFFKVPAFGSAFTSGNYLTAANLQFAIPKVPLVQLFADLGYLDAPGLTESFQYDAGVMVTLPLDIFAVYFPLVMSADLSNAFAVDAPYGEKISFMLNLNTGNVFELMRKLGL